jgi:hypothetical protein
LKPPPLKCRSHRRQAGRKSAAEENGKRREENIFRAKGKENGREEDNNFKPPELPHFQPDADSPAQTALGWVKS